MLDYSQSLISLSGRNGLGLNLGMRFDSEVCDAVTGVNDSERITYEYQVTENDQYYDLSGVRCAGMDTTQVHTFTDDSQLAGWEAIDQDDHNVSGYYYYLRLITITAKTTSGVDASGLNNFYNTRYNLGSAGRSTCRRLK